MRKIGIVIALCAITGVAHAELSPRVLAEYSQCMDQAHARLYVSLNLQYPQPATTRMFQEQMNIASQQCMEIARIQPGMMTHAESCELWKDC